MARLRISSIGAFDVTLDGEPMAGFDSIKVRALLAYRAVESERPVYRGTLAGLLWPQRSERVARQNLSQALSNLQAVIGDRRADPPFLEITCQAIRLDAESDCWPDTSAFSARLEVSGGGVHPPPGDDDFRIEQLR